MFTKSMHLFAETFANHTPGDPFIILSEVDSTNNYAMAKLHANAVPAGTCFQAVSQTAGKGQRGRQWQARPGENITMSVCLHPVHPSFPFLLSAGMALGCYDFIKEYVSEPVAIKWPNDVYVNDRKAAGILIENLFRGGAWEWAVAGTGVNVNQAGFGELSARATSLAIATGHDFDVTAAARRLHRHLVARHEWVAQSTPDGILSAYNAVLYRKNETVRLKKDSAVFSTVIREVNIQGELVTRDALERTFRVGEIQFL